MISFACVKAGDDGPVTLKWLGRGSRENMMSKVGRQIQVMPKNVRSSHV